MSALWKTMYKYLLRYSFLLLCFSGDLSASPQIIISDSTRGCFYLGEIEGTSGYGKKLNWKAEAKESMFRSGERLGATHIVLKGFIPVGAFNGVVVAKAYKCS